NAIDLLPLTDDWNLIKRTQERFTSNGSRVTLLQSAQLVEEQIAHLREKLITWSAQLGERRLGGKSLKEWFLLRGDKVSTWWFSLLSEKNPLKTDVFLRLAQIHAIQKQIQSERYDVCYIILENTHVARVV